MLLVPSAPPALIAPRVPSVRRVPNHALRTTLNPVLSRVPNRVPLRPNGNGMPVRPKNTAMTPGTTSHTSHRSVQRLKLKLQKFLSRSSAGLWCKCRRCSCAANLCCLKLMTESDD